MTLLSLQESRRKTKEIKKLKLLRLESEQSSNPCLEKTIWRFFT